METERGRVAALVALKSGDQAKSRLSSLPDDLRRRLAWAMAVDTLTALQDAVGHLLVVSDVRDLGTRLAQDGVHATVLPERGRAGMNAALRHGDHELRAGGVREVIACVGDLPALTAATVRELRTRVVGTGRFVVPDRSGVGTTMLIARDTALDPLFQGDSAARHLTSGAVSLLRPVADDLARARCDVDTEADLAVAYGWGLGSASSVLLASRPGWAARLTAPAVPGAAES